ncbi:ATP-binding cassette subfamily B protein [Nonlabens dokdonensis]|uniref:ABC-type multidrug/protein/lipid transporter ATP-binding and permease component n=2 Tax=Nonlabens dokdonensis TaxID=328515 RepID=L7W6W5_NONDD|nr:ABC transporter ATP-binding protein [Nonlabens dokdonensis]AGC75536.1 ABC-type multidrug/protein/lipid transporter ATP-binding and permease component [Nonlabens dokdonensis DSW-6]PZX43230.1 ATP-binding cassette subfamily B protein [Nonlabens dokdonensis]
MKELKKLNKLFAKYKWQLIGGVIVTIISRVLSLVLPKYVGEIINLLSDYTDASEAQKEVIGDQLTIYILYILGATLLAAGLTFIMRQLIIVVSRHLEYDLKNIVYQQYQRLSLGFYKQNRTGDLMNRISEDVSKVRMYMGPAIMYSINMLTLFAVVIPAMINTAPTLAVYTIIPLPILSVAIYVISREINKRSTLVQEYLSNLNTISQESFSGISVIKAYNLAPQMTEQFTDVANDSKDKNIDLARIQALFFPLMVLLIGLSNIMVIYIGGKQVIDGVIDVGTIPEFLIYVNMLTWPVAIVGWVTNMIQQAEASQKRINEFLDIEPAIQNLNEASTKVKGSIAFDKVNFIYEDTNIHALKDISFEIEAGKTLAILGKTGSGKSTILELIGRLYDIENGSLTIDNKEIRSLNLDDLRSSIGYVPQDAFLFSDTIGNNIAFGKKDASQEEIETAAKNAVVHKNITNFTKGYETVLGERGITLSGGQKQRVSIARAIIKKPQILLFDDCLSAVDTETEEKILNNLKKVTQDTTTIIVSHRVSSAKNADQIIVLDDGKIIERGNHDSLLNENGYYAELFANQMLEEE